MQFLTAEISAIPDVIVTCSALDRATPVVAEATIVIEAMSTSSESDDAGRKWFAYREIPNLRQYPVLPQEKRVLLIHSRAGEHWHERFVTDGSIALNEPPLGLAIDDLYAYTKLAA